MQLCGREPSAIAAGLLAWADTLSETSTETWRVPEGDSVHVSVTGQLPGGFTIRVFGGLRVTDCGVGTDLAPDAIATLPLATLHYLAVPGRASEEVTR